MSHNRSIGGLSKEDECYFKVYKVLICEARIILYYIFNWGCPRDLSQSFRIYAKNKLNMNRNQMKSSFDKTMIIKMDANPKGDEFDVSLLYNCIICGCSDINEADKDLVIKPIKNFRNAMIHMQIEITDKATMNKCIEELRDMLEKAILKAQEVYKRNKSEIDGIIKQMDDSIQEICMCPLEVTDVDTYKKKIAEIRKANETVIQDKGIVSLKENFKEISNVDPASWISGRETLNVKMVFTRLDFITKCKDENSCRNVSHEELLELKNDDGKDPIIIVIEGEAGSGKSTLAKFLLADWANLDTTNPLPSIRGLQEYDLVLYVECRNKNISRFLDLLLTVMPQASYDMTDTDLIRSVLALKTLVVVDGLDEMNPNSEKLLNEMVNDCVQKSEKRLHFIITTRPQKLSSIPKLCGSKPWLHIRITGIPPERRVEFVEKLHDEMIKENQSDQNTSYLADYIKHSQCRLGEHYRLPLNLTFLTYLWANDPMIVNSVTSATSLYDAVLKLLKSRVVSRIEEVSQSMNDFSDMVNKFVETVFEVYLETHQSTSDSIKLSHESHQKLKSKCKELGLPFDDMCGAFFVVDNEWSIYTGNEMYLSAPHKSIMEFFSAYRIFNCFIETDDYVKDIEALMNKYKHLSLKLECKKEPKSLNTVFQNLVFKGKDPMPIDLSHYQNVLLHLGGLMALKKISSLQQYGQELVDLLKNSEMTEAQWLDLVAEAECDTQFTSLVAKEITKKLVVRDGHTCAAIEIFKNLDTNLPIQVIFETEVRYIPEIEILMEKLAERDCSVELHLKNHWKNPQNGNSTTLLKKLYGGGCFVTRFTGNLDDLKVLPVDVEHVRLTIANDVHAKQITNDITALKEKQDLEYLGVHVMKLVSPGELKPLPVVKPVRGECGTIWLSDVGDENVGWACDAARALLPQDKCFNSIMFPRCQMSAEGFKKLLTKMKEVNIAVWKKGSLKTDSSSIDQKDVIMIRNFARDALKCGFQCGDESTVW